MHASFQYSRGGILFDGSRSMFIESSSNGFGEVQRRGERLLCQVLVEKKRHQL